MLAINIWFEHFNFKIMYSKIWLSSISFLVGVGFILLGINGYFDKDMNIKTNVIN